MNAQKPYFVVTPYNLLEVEFLRHRYIAEPDHKLLFPSNLSSSSHTQAIKNIKIVNKAILKNILMSPFLIINNHKSVSFFRQSFKAIWLN